MIQKQLFRVFQLIAPEVKHFYHKNTWKNSQIHIHLVKMISNMKFTLAKNLLPKESKPLMSLERFF